MLVGAMVAMVAVKMMGGVMRASFSILLSSLPFLLYLFSFLLYFSLLFYSCGCSFVYVFNYFWYKWSDSLNSIRDVGIKILVPITFLGPNLIC